MGATTVLTCTCEHEYQDKLYGKGKRLHNYMNGQKNGKEWRCTVCNNEK